MKRMIKSFSAIALVVIMFVTIIPASAFAETEEDPYSGKAGPRVTWTLADGTVTFSGSGTGSMYSYGEEELPKWHTFTSEINKIVVEEGVKSLGSYAFYNLDNVESVSLPNSLKDIKNYTFADCDKLTEITLPNNVRSIGVGAFYKCSELTSVNLSIYLSAIEEYAFAGCGKINEINIPENVSSIHSYAFADCIGLKSIKIPASTTRIESIAFYNTNSLQSIDVDANNKYYSSVDGVLYDKDVDDKKMKTLIYCPQGKTGSVNIPEGVTTIKAGAFNNCSKLEAVTIPASVTNIEGNAFTSCSALKNVYYGGTACDWNLLGIDNTNSVLLNANVHPAKISHSYDEGKVTKEATCKETGVKTFTCTVCKNSYTESIKKTDHRYEGAITKEPTCKEEGLKTYTCKDCGDKSKPSETLAIVGHNYIETVIKEATCMEDGLAETKCKWCNKEGDTRVIDGANNHKYKGVVTKEPTCKETGVKIFTCTACKKSYTETIEKIAHKYEWKTVKEPTCCVEGLKEGICTRTGCGHKTTETIPVDSSKHVWGSELSIKPATISNAGAKSVSCLNGCNQTKQVEAIHKISAISLSNAEYVYNGKVRTPSVTVKNSADKTISSENYAVTYEDGRKVPGTYKVTVKFSGEYAGEEIKTFNILGPAITGPSKVTTALYGYDDVKVSWKKVSKCDGYYVAYKKASDTEWKFKFVSKSKTSYKIKNLADGVKYNIRVYPAKKIEGKYYKSSKYKAGTSITTLKKLDAPKVSKKSKASVLVKWDNISGETGYQISKSTKKSKTNIVSTYKTTKGTNKSLKATKGKNYYYKVRAYKVVDGKKIYGPWSSAVKYKLK